MRRRTYVPLRPAGSSQHSAREESSASSSSSSAQASQRPGACLDCRSRKIKCDGVRPVCSACSKRGKSQCIFPEKLGAAHSSIEIVNLVKTLPRREADSLVDLLREGKDPLVVVAHFHGVREGTVPLGLHETHHVHLETELSSHYPKAYAALPEIDTHALAKSSLLHPVSLPPGKSSSVLFPGKAPSPASNPPVHLHAQFSHHIKPCDERLQSLQVGFWTDLAIPNDLAAQVLSVYITTDHPLLGLFDARLFIDDLVQPRNRFCSRFLFHAVMYIGCQMYCAFDKTLVSLATSFGEEAQRLQTSEPDSYMTMAGCVLLSASLMSHGKDHAVLEFAMEALRMGQRLDLFSTDMSTMSDLHEDDQSDDERSATCYAAWGVFNWNVMISVFYRQPGSGTPKFPPAVPIPGERLDAANVANPTTEDESEARLQYRIFPLLCHFWRLVHKVNWIYYTVEDSPPIVLRLILVEHALRELIAWVERLPVLLIRRQHGTHHFTVFLIWLHTAILDMFKPFVKTSAGNDRHLQTFTAQDSTPAALCRASINQLKHLVIKYRSRHVESTYSILWHTGLIYLANGVLSFGDPEWHLYFLLCIYAYERLNRPYRIAEVITEGLLAVAMRDTDMTSDEAHQLMLRLREHGLEHVKEDLKEKIRATFMVDLDLALTDPEAAMAENLASNFEDLAIFQGLINPGAIRSDDAMDITSASPD